MPAPYSCKLSYLWTGYWDWRVEWISRNRLNADDASPAIKAQEADAERKLDKLGISAVSIALAMIVVAPLLIIAIGQAIQGLNSTSRNTELISTFVIGLFVLGLIVLTLRVLRGWAKGALQAFMAALREVARLRVWAAAVCVRGYELKNGLRSPFSSLT